MKHINIVLALLTLLISSCIEEYKIPTTLSVPREAELVIQGRILAGEESVIYITKTQPLGEMKLDEPITHAKVTVIGQNGYESSPPAAHREQILQNDAGGR